VDKTRLRSTNEELVHNPVLVYPASSYEKILVAIATLLSKQTKGAGSVSSSPLFTDKIQRVYVHSNTISDR
jgi:hypothetical protein